MTSTSLPRLAWSVREVSIQLGLAYDAVLKAVHEGQIEAIRIGKHHRIPDAELTRLVGEASRSSARPVEQQLTGDEIEQRLTVAINGRPETAAELAATAKPLAAVGRQSA